MFTQEQDHTVSTTAPPTAAVVRSGLLWSLTNNLVVRVGTLAVGIALARMLTPAQFGAYAVALTVQTILMTVADLGLSADLIRSPDPERRAPTVGTLGLVTGCTLALACAATATPVSRVLGSPQAAPAVVVLSVTLALGGIGIVPYARLQRDFAQRALFLIASVDLVVSTTITLALVASGWGVVSLALGRAVAQTVTVVLQFRFTGSRPRFGWDRDLAGSVLTFGVPVAATNLLSWVLLSVDYVIVARVVGPVALAFYVLAFNVSTWPMTAIGQVVRSVALPAFARESDVQPGRSVGDALALTGGLAALAGALLAGLAGPLITFVYGGRWGPAAPVLAALAVFGACRVAFDLMASYLLARGRSRSVLRVQLVWSAALVPGLVLGAVRWGTVGAAWAHVVVALALVLPAYVVAIAATGVPLRRLVGALWPPALAALPTGVVAHAVGQATGHSWSGVVLGGVTGVLVFAALAGHWLSRRLADLRGRPAALAGTVHLVVDAQTTEHREAS